MSRIASSIRRTWRGLRGLLGDDAYERYLVHQRARRPGEKPLERQAFYLSQLDRRWARISRCC